jgi:adenylate cyclase
MAFDGNGELIPVGGGDAIPLLRTPLVVGRRESCDICLRFPNVSGRHCELSFKGGFWVVKDLRSTNGLKINGERLAEGGQKLLRPGDVLTLAKREYKIDYVASDRLSTLEDDLEDLIEEEEEIMGKSLLERAGLERPQDPRKPGQRPHRSIYEQLEAEDEDDD